jgi:signal transduction histidine kinase
VSRVGKLKRVGRTARVDRAGRVAQKTKSKRVSSVREKFRKARKEFDTLKESKLSSLLAAGVAHEFNNILGAVDGHAEWALESGSTEDFVDALKTIRVACARSAQVTRALQQFAQPLEEQTEVLGLRALLEELHLEFRPMLEKKLVTLKIAMPASLRVKGDRQRVSEIFRNLIKNSIEAFEVVSDKNEIGVEVEKAGRSLKKVRMRVWDNGPGIAEVFRDMIFRPFFTTKGVMRAFVSGQDSSSSREPAGGGVGRPPEDSGGGSFAGGTGLGLYRSKVAADEMGGRLSLKSSTPGHGTQWLLELPRP